MTTLTQVPVVDYLVLGDTPHLVAHQCDTCGARYFDARDACASCFGADFTDRPVATRGTLDTYTIVAVAAPGVAVPFVAGVVDCDGTSVRTNIVNVEPSPTALRMGMPLRLTTFAIGADDNGIEAIGFGFEPADNDKDE
jgi:uncharacterized OB-fold protein